MTTRFLQEEDYDVQARQEIIRLLDTSEDLHALMIAERMAIDQIKQYISGRYDVASMFAATGNQRDHFLVMIVVDMTLYHLWSKRAPGKISEIRSQRYQDALDWVRSVGEGTIKASLPVVEEGTSGDIRIKSKYTPNDNKF